MQRRRPFQPMGMALLCLGVAAFVSLQCTDRDAASTTPARASSEGERLMRQHCGTCHLPVPAKALDRTTWRTRVLPAMASKVGIGTLWGEYYPKTIDSTGSSISIEAWASIVEHYERTAPDTLDQPAPPASLQTRLPLFSVRTPQWEAPDPPATVFVQLDPVARQIYYTDALTRTLHRTDQTMAMPTVVRSNELGVDLHFVEDQTTGLRHAIGTSIGTMRAIDNANGAVWALDLSTDSIRVLASGLPRPVRSIPEDFNRDGLRDWIVCGFGHTQGGLFLLEQQTDGTFTTNVLRGVPGAVDAQVGDFNRDGYPDVMALFAHGNEGVWLFTNDGRGGFSSRNLLRFPPVYGSTDFQVADFNNDGALDVLYVSGDNADFSAIPKPYHGIYIFINQGNFEYEQSYFYHFDGATEAIAEDFDADGDLDIGAIAFFADLAGASAQDFVYLEQTRSLAFTPYAPPLPDGGRKMNMDAGDYDGDTDVDLLLGHYAARGYLYEGSDGPGASSFAPFIVLENQTR